MFEINDDLLKSKIKELKIRLELDDDMNEYDNQLGVYVKSSLYILSINNIQFDNPLVDDYIYYKSLPLFDQDLLNKNRIKEYEIETFETLKTIYYGE